MDWHSGLSLQSLEHSEKLPASEEAERSPSRHWPSVRQESLSQANGGIGRGVALRKRTLWIQFFRSFYHSKLPVVELFYSEDSGSKDIISCTEIWRIPYLLRLILGAIIPRGTYYSP